MLIGASQRREAGETTPSESRTTPQLMHRPRVSVIIPAFNVDAYILESIRSVQGQTYTNFEIVVVDDGSTDGTAEVVAQSSQEIRLIRQANRGLPLARNAGILAAQGELVAFLDADDVWLPEYLEKQVDLINANGGRCLVFCIALVWDGLHTPTTIWDTTLAFDEGDPLVSIVRGCYPIPTAVVVPRSVLVEVGLFHQVSGEDANLWKRIAQQGVPFRKNPTPLVWYRQRLSSISRRESSGREAAEHLVVALKRIHRDPTMPQHVKNEAAKRLSAIHRTFAWLALQGVFSGDFAEARACWLNALKAHPWNLLYVAGFVSVALMPKPTRWALFGLSRLRRTVRGTTASSLP